MMDSPYDRSYLAAQRQKVVDAVHAILVGGMGIIEGARLLTRLRPTVTRDDFDPDFIVFIAVASETDDLPVGKEREYWASSALEEKDRQIWQAEETYREEVFAACQVLLERFSK